MAERCSFSGCEERARFRYRENHRPDEQLGCNAHAAMAASIATCMGLPLAMLPIDPPHVEDMVRLAITKLEQAEAELRDAIRMQRDLYADLFGEEPADG